jgi:hypothetical protein
MNLEVSDSTVPKELLNNRLDGPLPLDVKVINTVVDVAVTE